MKAIHCPNEIRSHLVKIEPMEPFTPKSTSKLKFSLRDLHFRDTIVLLLLSTHSSLSPSPEVRRQLLPTVI